MSTLDNAALVKIIRGMQKTFEREGYGTILSVATDRDLRKIERQVTEDRVRKVMSEEYDNFDIVIADLVAVLHESS